MKKSTFDTLSNKGLLQQKEMLEVFAEMTGLSFTGIKEHLRNGRIPIPSISTQELRELAGKTTVRGINSPIKRYYRVSDIRQWLKEGGLEKLPRKSTTKKEA